MKVHSSSESSSDEDNGEEDEMGSDIEGNEGEDDGLPDAKAWGHLKNRYYNTDYVDKDFGGTVSSSDHKPFFLPVKLQNV